MDSYSLKNFFVRTAAIVLVLLLMHPAAFAGSKYVAKTAQNVDISSDDLSSLLLPLTQSALVAEAAAWQDVLEQKVSQLSRLEIQSRNSDQQTGVIEQIAVMRVEQGGINKRFKIVLDALDSKGGDVKEQRLYLAAVSGIKLDVQDTTAGLLAVKEWMKSREGGQLLVMNLLKFLAVVALVVFASRVLSRLTDSLIARRPTSLLLESFIRVGIRRGVIAVGFIAALPIIGINVGPVLALIGAAGLVIGLALQGTLSNFASGVLILLYRPYDMNDAITVSGVSGTVSGMNLLYTTIKTFDNQLITIPNNNVWNDTIINVTGSQERRVDLVFGISYADDFGKAQDILRSILQQHPKVLETPAPNIRLHELAESSVKLICRPWAKTQDYWDVYWDITEAVKREFDKQGISIPFPRHDVYFYGTTALPESPDKAA